TSQQAAATEAASQQAAATQAASPQAAANGEASQQAAATESSSPQSRPDAREQDADERNSQLAEAIPVQTGGVLLPRGRLTLEPQFRYNYASVNRVQIAGYTILPALTLGLIDVTRHDRSTITSTLAARYGLTDRIELDLSVPYVAAWSRFRLSPKNTDGNLDKNQTADGHGIGDVQFGLRTQLNRGTSSIASFVAGVGVRVPTGRSPYEVKREGLFDQFIEQEVPTGSGFYSLNPTLSFVYPTEPGVLFGNLHYSWNIPRTIGATQPNTDQPYGKIDPGDVIGASLGMGLSLNEKLSLSLSYDHSMVFQTRQNGLISEDSVPLQIGTLGIGATKRRNSKISYSFMIGVGVTDDAPDVSLTFRVPTTWDLLK
ncbi:MAG: transporter, partial [Myxococcota bacterium]